MAEDSMHRTQVSLEKWQYRYLTERARRSRTSIADIIRQLVTKAAEEDMPADRSQDPIFSIIGMGEGDGQPVGRNHDHYLYNK